MFSCNWNNRLLIELCHTKFTSVSGECSQRKHVAKWGGILALESLGWKNSKSLAWDTEKKSCLLRRHFICFHFGERWRHFKTVVFWSTWPIFYAVPSEKNISCGKDSPLHGWVSAFPSVCENSWHTCSSEFLDVQVKGSRWLGGLSTVKRNR